MAILMLTVVCSGQLYSADKKLHNMLKFNPLGMFNGPVPFNSEYRAIYERIIRYDIGYYVGVSSLTRELFIDKSKLFKTNVPWTLQHKIGGFGVYLGAKKYLTTYYRDAPRGVYITPNFDMFYSKFESLEDVLFRSDQDFQILPDDWVKTYVFDFNTTAGYQFVINNSFIFDIFAGAGFRVNTFNRSPAISSDRLSVFDFDNIEQKNGLRLIFGFDMGFAW